MATAVAQALRCGYPQATIAWAVGSWSRPVLAGNPHVDELVDAGLVGSGRYGLRDYGCLVRRLREGSFDLAVVLERSPLITLLPLLAGIPHRAGLDSEGRGFPLTIPVRLDWLHPQHEVDTYLDVVRALGLHVGDVRPTFYPSPEDQVWAEERLRELGLMRAPLVAIHPGGAVNPGMALLAKRWLPERFAALADRLVEAWGVHILLVGGPGDQPALDAVMAASKHRAVIYQSGPATLGQLAALYEHCCLVIGNDTGAVHLAEAVGTPVVMIFGPSDPRVYGPYHGAGISVRQDVGCAGRCFAPGRWIATTCDGRCISAVTVDDVWEALHAVWAVISTGGNSRQAPGRLG